MAAAVDDRNNDVPVILPGLCLSRSHHLFGLIERDRSAIVTDTFVNRHHSLPFVGAAQHGINVSEALGQSDFAERALWNIGTVFGDRRANCRSTPGRNMSSAFDAPLPLDPCLGRKNGTEHYTSSGKTGTDAREAETGELL